MRGQELAAHRMHSERMPVGPSVVAAVAACRRRGGRVVAVGTTVVRALETAARIGALAPFDGETDIFIQPGFRFRVVDALVTNFHLPESTLLMLVAAFAGTAARARRVCRPPCSAIPILQLRRRDVHHSSACDDAI